VLLITAPDTDVDGEAAADADVDGEADPAAAGALAAGDDGACAVGVVVPPAWFCELLPFRSNPR
jgi:hypothetical protein